MPWAKNFDVDEALERARDAFWANGYEATSMRDLLLAMGIQKGSFYATYGSKHAAFLGALAGYVEMQLGGMADLSAVLSPRKAIEAMLDLIYADATGPDKQRGCMLVNCALEVASSDPEASKVVQRGFTRHEKLIQDWIVAAQAGGEIHSDLDARVTAKTMLAIIMGLRVHARAGSPKATIKLLAEQAASLLDP